MNIERAAPDRKHTVPTAESIPVAQGASVTLSDDMITIRRHSRPKSKLACGLTPPTEASVLAMELDAGLYTLHLDCLSARLNIRCRGRLKKRRPRLCCMLSRV